MKSVVVPVASDFITAFPVRQQVVLVPALFPLQRVSLAAWVLLSLLESSFSITTYVESRSDPSYSTRILETSQHEVILFLSDCTTLSTFIGAPAQSSWLSLQPTLVLVLPRIQTSESPEICHSAHPAGVYIEQIACDRTN